MPKIEIINPLYYPNWDDLVLSKQDYSFFHSSFWARVLSKSYGYKPCYFSIFNNGCLVALIPLMEIKSLLTGYRGVSLPFSDHCEPIFSNDTLFQDVWNEIISYGEKSHWKFVELRGGENFFQDISPSSCYYTHALDISKNVDEILSSFRDSTRRNIKKAIRKGVKVKKCNSFDSLKEFYRLNCMTRKFYGLPSQPFYFFKNIYNYVIRKNQGGIILAFYNGKAIAGAVYFLFGEKVIYKYSAWDRSYQNFRPNNLVMWEAINGYSQNGYRSICFGRTKVQHRGLLQFKEGWGVEKRLIKYFKYDFKKEKMVNKGAKNIDFYKFILSKMPSSFLNCTGLLLYRHIG